jgi:predicted ATPase
MTTSIEMPAPDSVEAEGQKSPALDSLDVDGYKSIRSARINLGPINVLIGANGSGKSNLVGLFGLLADLADRRLQFHVARHGGANALLHFGQKTTSSLRVSLRFGLYGYEAALVPSSGDTLVFEHELIRFWKTLYREPGAEPAPPDPLEVYVTHAPSGSKETALNDRRPEDEVLVLKPVVAAMTGWRPFHFHDTGRSSPAKQKHKLDDNRTLRAEGDNLAPFLFALRTAAPGAYRRIVEAVRSVAPFFDDFVLEPDVINPGVIQLAWRHTMDDGLFMADSLSDGTLRFICLATLLLQPTLPSVIVIDEPELGLHPFAIGQLAALVRAAATKAQVILATQSVTLLDQFDASEVIVANRSNGESTFDRLPESALTEWKQEYSLGELWLKNVLGGRPR